MCLQTDVRNKLISLYSRPCSFTKQIAASLTSILQPDAQHQGALALLPLPFLRHQFPQGGPLPWDSEAHSPHQLGRTDSCQSACRTHLYSPSDI